MKTFILTFLLGSMNCWGYVTVQPLNLSDYEFEKNLKSNKNYVSYIDHFISTQMIWKHELDIILETSYSKEELTAGTKLFFSAHPMTEDQSLYLQQQTETKLWSPLKTELKDSIELVFPNDFQVFLNGKKLNQNTLKAPKEGLIHLTFISNKYRPQFFFGTPKEFVSPQLVPFISNGCDISEKMELEKEGLYVFSPNDCSSKPRPNFPSNSSQWALWTAGALIFATGMVYLSGYELVLLGL